MRQAHASCLTDHFDSRVIENCLCVGRIQCGGGETSEAEPTSRRIFFLHLCSTSPSFLLPYTSSFTSQAVLEEEIASTMLSATILGLEKARRRDFYAYRTQVMREGALHPVLSLVFHHATRNIPRSPCEHLALSAPQILAILLPSDDAF